MKHIASLAVAAFVIAMAYFYQFGLPEFINVTASTDSAVQTTAEKREQGRPQGGRRRVPGASYVTVTDVVYQPYTDSFSAIGTGKAQRNVSLVSEISGQIETVWFDGTQDVAKGDILIQLDDTSEQINVAIAQANLQKAQDNLERYQTLQKRNKGMVADVTLNEEKAAVAVARGNLALAEVTLRNRAIRSPIEGKLGLSDLEPGDFLANGARIVDINNTDTILVNFELPERAVSVLAKGKTVSITTPAKQGQIFEGKISAFDSVIDEITRTVTVKAELANKNGQLWPGMTFAVNLQEISVPLASLPALSMVWTREGTHVWVMENNKVQPLPVTFRKRIDDTVWVEGDLNPGMEIVVDGVQKLRPGATVSVADSAIENDPSPRQETTKKPSATRGKPEASNTRRQRSSEGRATQREDKNNQTVQNNSQRSESVETLSKATQ